MMRRLRIGSRSVPPLTWALFEKSFEICLWWDDVPAWLFEVDWSRRITFTMERYR